MAVYRLIEFGGVDVPQYNATTSFGIGTTAASTVLTIGGTVFDPSRGARLPALNARVEHVGQYLADTLDGLQDQVAAMQQKVGTRNDLWRERLSDDELQWCYARLLSDTLGVGALEALQQTMRLNLVRESAAWYSEDAQNITHNLTGAQPKDIDLPNATTGDGATQTNVVITITAGNAAMTNFHLYDDYSEGVVDWDFTGTIAATESVVIDTGGFSVLNDGVNAYNSLVLDPVNHTSAYWMEMLAGTHPLRVEWTGGGTGATVNFNYYEAYV
jgi:hypothetical protein